jgi:hypothetical protein
MDNRSIFLSVRLVAAVISIIAGSNLTQFALAAVSATKSTILSAAPANSLAGMPGSLDAAKTHLAEALKEVKLGNTQAAATQIKITNRTITQFQQGMLNIMNAHNTPSPFMAAGNISQQQSMLDIMNSNRTQSPLSMAVGGNSTHHQEMRNMMSMLNNINVNVTADRSGSTTASHPSAK